MADIYNKKYGADSPFDNKSFGGISSDTLRLLATVFMLADHLWASVIPGNRWLTDIGRLAFPIYAFMISEGYIHTSDSKKYLKRLLFFAFVSEIPFNLFYSGSVIDPFNQNVLFTFVWGLLAIMQIDKIKRNVFLKSEKPAIVLQPVIKALLMIALISFGAKFTFTDYKFSGYLTVVMFYIFRGFPFAWLCQLVGMVYLNWIWFKGEILLIEFFGRVLEIPNQAYAVFALVFIWMYNGKKKKSAKTGISRYGFYLFYPAHMLVLYFIQQIISSL